LKPETPEVLVGLQIDILCDILAVFIGLDQPAYDLSHQPLGCFNQVTEGVHVAREYEVDELPVRGRML
jgi:hypothetical protein